MKISEKLRSTTMLDGVQEAFYSEYIPHTIAKGGLGLVQKKVLLVVMIVTTLVTAAFLNSQGSTQSVHAQETVSGEIIY